MPNTTFLSVEDIIFIHHQEVQLAGSDQIIRDLEAIRACKDAPKSSFGGKYLQDLFGMAATYITCLAIRHPFVDGNKRVALASALTFLYMNGYVINESYDQELADLVLNLLNKKITKDDLTDHLRSNASKI